MHRKAFLTSLLLALSLMQLQSQLRTALTLDAGPRWSLIKVDDPGGYFQPMAILSSTAGGGLEQEIGYDLSVSAGLWFQNYSTGMNMEDGRPDRQRLDAYNSLQIPIRVHYHIQPTEYPVFISPHLGYVLRLGSMEASDRFSMEGVITAPDGSTLSYTHTRVDEQPGKHLLELGVGIGLQFAGNWQASARLGWTSGLFNTASNLATVEYIDPDGRSRTASYNSKGNSLSTTLAVHVPLSNVWQNRDYRIRSRIEHSSFDGKAVDRKGSFYVGGDVGLLWRLFHSTDPALGARPMENRGFLRYSNLHTGVYGGYMFSDELGLDLGVMYQRSSTFYSLMFDHEVDFAGKTAAPLYLEVPLRLRYFYPILDEELYAVVYGGISLLTQFASGEYDAPGGSFSYSSPTTGAPMDATVSASARRPSSFRPLLRFGAGTEYRIPIEFPLFATLYVGYAQGFMDTEVVSVSTSMTQEPPERSLDWQGSGWSVDLGVKIPMAFDDRQNCVRLTREKKIR